MSQITLTITFDPAKNAWSHSVSQDGEVISAAYAEGQHPGSAAMERAISAGKYALALALRDHYRRATEADKLRYPTAGAP